MDGVATVVLNVKVIHKKVKLGKPTFIGFPSAKVWPEMCFPAFHGTVTEGPIRLQAENSRVRFANIGLKRLNKPDDDHRMSFRVLQTSSGAREILNYRLG